MSPNHLMAAFMVLYLTKKPFTMRQKFMSGPVKLAITFSEKDVYSRNTDRESANAPIAITQYTKPRKCVKEPSAENPQPVQQQIWSFVLQPNACPQRLQRTKVQDGDADACHDRDSDGTDDEVGEHERRKPVSSA